MSKELKVLKEIREKCGNEVLKMVWNKNREHIDITVNNNLDIIESTLNNYENIKVRLDNTQTLLWENKKKVDAFNIIVKKDVVIGLLKGILHANKSLHTASYYNSFFVATYRHLTQEEFDLLKEVLL